MKNTYQLRAIAAQIISQVLDKGRSLSVVLPEVQNHVPDKDKALLQELCFGTLRVLPRLEHCLKHLMTRPLNAKKRLLHFLLMVGLYQLIYTRIPPHAILSETVKAAAVLKYPQVKGLINAILREFERRKENLLQKVKAQDPYLHPQWLLQRIKTAYPEQWPSILRANNERPPMWIRVNVLHNSREKYMTELEKSGIKAKAHSICLDAVQILPPCSVKKLPGFDLGWATVQDVAAQRCIDLLDPQNDDYILDLCAAPGVKTTHILERAPSANVLAIDIDAKRLERIKENLQRLHLSARLKVANALVPEQWYEGKMFDKILLDVPCSATGIIRRHPDIKWLRRDSDIATLAQLQSKLIKAVWPTLRQGGMLLYSTCSILPEENQQQITGFLKQQLDAESITIQDAAIIGLQNLPQTDEGDGFFYAKITKRS
ncbi:16S rRNA (cytosine(967)-C(5))-methyltransferase RsmB [Candidatus Williamhamiltonella defendens]|uniref:16S rRNA (cytosine(967)-C(5))-methyltransferase RsmB n=1 Tax=Candidatus Williamhamiltonella defendens TaxID=138072 RepID=UPI00130EDE9C|nr:16S rRNA (cytosine(967)-C(5))-methyltransferase RsmB [Candidatus Hamiltonella defensa]